ncbi:MAG: OprO/OprP family phosphate-selective porin [Acidobacteria bacterium]|nr:OprO/OprP family phosphate-selective porin [Acidobacteriota bacterium]
MNQHLRSRFERRAAFLSLFLSAAALSLRAQTPPPTPTPTPAPGGENPSPAAPDDAKMRAEVERQMKLMEAKRWIVGLSPNGGGAYIKSPDGKVYFRLYGYAQPIFTLTDASNAQAFGTTDFRIRRARLDFSVDYDDIWKLFLEIDGQASGGGTGLVEGYVQSSYVKGRHYLRFGKYISPFSTENLRSSRALDTVERFIAVNTMFGLPGLDVQFGPMAWGYVDAGHKLTYYAGVFNGNASAAVSTVNGYGGNARDNNKQKEFQTRLNFQPVKELTIGGAFDYDQELDQNLQLTSYSGAKLIAVTVRGKRRGYDADLHWKKEKCSFDAEWLHVDFPDNPNNAHRDVKLHGGYAQAGYWVTGSEAKGVQGILRGEYAELEGAAVETVRGRTITAVTAGANIWFNGWTRLQIDAIEEHVNGNGNGAYTGGSKWRPTLLTELQVKF